MYVCMYMYNRKPSCIGPIFQILIAVQSNLPKAITPGVRIVLAILWRWHAI